MKKYKGLIIITTLITLLPMVAGLLLWNRLPEQVPTHWNAAGEIDGWSGKGFAVFGLPLFMTAVHLLCSLATHIDPKNKAQGAKPLVMVLWICPAVALLMMGLVYGSALGLGTGIRVEVLMPILMGLMLIIIGNYLPKCKHNYTIGIKLPWTLDSEENWNATHRFAGKVWILGGVLVMLMAFGNSALLMLGVLLAMVLVPTVYSYLYYRKHEGK